jgi:hypothetical protein
MWTGEAIHLGMRFWLLILAWLIFPVAGCFPHSAWLSSYALGFPEGVCGLLAGNGYHPRAYNTIFILDWGFPLGLTLWCLLEQRRVKYFILYSILCAIFILNVIAFRVAFQHWNP